MPECPQPDFPFARAVIRDGRITLNRWSPRLMTGGPLRQVLKRLAEQQVVVADLFTSVREDGAEDLRVRWVPENSGTTEARGVLAAWAEQVGYASVWLPDAWIEFPDRAFEGGRARVVCPTCSLEWDDDSTDFWATVRSCGYFPATCPVCNGSLPEWEVEPVAAPAGQESALADDPWS